MQRKAIAVMVDRELLQLSKDLLFWMTETWERHQDSLRTLPASPAAVSLEPLNELFRACISAERLDI
jgi:hypothetical protein